MMVGFLPFETGGFLVLICLAFLSPALLVKLHSIVTANLVNIFNPQLWYIHDPVYLRQNNPCQCAISVLVEFPRRIITHPFSYRTSRKVYI